MVKPFASLVISAAQTRLLILISAAANSKITHAHPMVNTSLCVGYRMTVREFIKETVGALEVPGVLYGKAETGWEIR